MTTPLTPAEIAELRDIPVIGGTPYNVISTPRDQWERLVSIAEDHARLHAAFGEECIRAGLLAEELDGRDAERDALRAELADRKLIASKDGTEALKAELAYTHLRRGELVIERDASRAEVATLKARNELLERVREAADHYVKAHAGQVVRLQSATDAQHYELASQALDTALRDAEQPTTKETT